MFNNNKALYLSRNFRSKRKINMKDASLRLIKYLTKITIGISSAEQMFVP